MASPSTLPEKDGLAQLAYLLLILALLTTGLWLGAAVLLPIVEAFILWFIINALAAALRRVPRLGSHIGRGLAVAVAAVLVTSVALLAVYSGVRGVLAAGPHALTLQTSFDPIITRIATLIGSDEAAVVNRVVDAIGLETLMQRFVLGLLGLLNQFGIIAIFVAFLFADQALFPRKLERLVSDAPRRARVQAVLARISNGIRSYLWIMTKVSALTAAISYAVLVAFGVSYPMFWAVLVFFLNFIPTIGSILGTLLPTAFALVQFPDLSVATYVLVLLGTVQLTIGNVVFPRMAGNSLNLSFFVTILCLFVWGALWGITGMFLAVPITSMLVIILAQFDETRGIAILLSKDGNVETIGEEPT